MLLTNLLLCTAFGKGFVVAEGGNSFVEFPTTTGEVDLASVILSRNIDGNVVLQRAAAIFHNRLSDSAPLQDAAMDLLRTCKASKNTQDRETAEVMESKAKQIYAIRAAMFDLKCASFAPPRACSVLAEPAQRSWYQASRSSLSDSANLPSMKELEGCVKGLFDVNNSWTSFTSHRQDANTLCEVPGTENASRMILELLNDVNGIIPEWMDIFRSEKEAHAIQLEDRKHFLQQIYEMENQYRTDLSKERDDAKAKIVELQRMWESQVSSMGKHADTKMIGLSGQVDRMQNDLNGYTQNFVAARGEHESLLTTYHAMVLEALQLQQNGIQDIDIAVGSLLSTYAQANGGIMVQSEALSHQLSSAMKEATARQSELSLGQSEFAAMQYASIERQKETLAFSRQLEEDVANMLGQVKTFMKFANGPMRAVSAVVSGDFGKMVKLTIACAAITFLLIIFGQIRFGMTLLSCCVLYWILPSIAVDSAEAAPSITAGILSSGQFRHVAWLSVALASISISVYFAIWAFTNLLRLAYDVPCIDSSWKQQRNDGPERKPERSLVLDQSVDLSCGRHHRFQSDSVSTPQRNSNTLAHQISPSSRHYRAFERASTVEPEMIGYY